MDGNQKGQKAFHIPVLLDEVLALLQPKKGGTFIDGTAGGGGHSMAIAGLLGPGGTMLCIDQDQTALAIIREKFSTWAGLAHCIHGNFSQMAEYCKSCNIADVDGILLDLGISSIALDNPERGFSFGQDGPLDMRMDQGRGLCAADIVNSWSAEELERLFREFGEEPLSRRYARAICGYRADQRLTRTRELWQIIHDSTPERVRRKLKIDPATRVFQALRLEVNGELESLQSVLPQMRDLLHPGGRCAIISFHSLEDRIVKHFFRRESRDCICPEDFPICTCNHNKQLKVLTRKPISPSTAEVEKNRRARSARLRVAEKC